VRHAEAGDLWQIASEIVRLSEAARAGKAGREMLTGSTITVSSLGALGGIAATPIINPPEVAIVGVNKIVERPVVRSGRIEVAKMMNLSSSFDHRVVDGFDAAAFIQTVKNELEAPGRLPAGARCAAFRRRRVFQETGELSSSPAMTFAAVLEGEAAMPS